MATVKTKPKSQAQKEKRQAAKDATILSRAAAAVKAPATKAPKAPKRVAPVAPAVDSQQIAQLRAEVDRLTAENGQLQAQIEQKGKIIFRMNETVARLVEEKAAIEKIHQSNMDFLKANHGQWMLIQWEGG